MFKLGIAIIALTLLVSIGGAVVEFYTVNQTANIAYSRAFGSDIKMAYETGSIASAKDYVIKIWNNMNKTFDQSNYDNIYADQPWLFINSACQVPENNMASTNSYFESLTNEQGSLTILVNQANNIGTGQSGTIGVTYQELLDQARDEMQRKGGLDWVIKGAYMQQEYPAAYWSWQMYVILIIVAIVGVIGGICVLFYTPKRKNEYVGERYSERFSTRRY